MRSVIKRMTTAGRPLRNIVLPLAMAASFFTFSESAWAAVQITVDKNTQTMTVAIDGEPRYKWPVSTGVPAHETPGGAFKTFRMEADHYSKEWDDAPMPHSIFFTKQGHAIHGTDSLNRLGSPASHGCVRLSRANAATLYALVERQGVLNTTVTLTGSSQVALARTAKPRVQQANAGNDTTGSVGAPVQLTPQAGTYSGDGYSEPAPAPAYRQVYPSQQGAYRVQRGYPSTYDNGGYYAQRDYQPAYPPQRYYGYSD